MVVDVDAVVVVGGGGTILAVRNGGGGGISNGGSGIVENEIGNEHDYSSERSQQQKGIMIL